MGQFSVMMISMPCLCFAASGVVIWTYTDSLCQSSTHSVQVQTVDTCSSGVMYSCTVDDTDDLSTGSTDHSQDLVNTGFFATNTFYGLNNCDGYAYTIIYQLGVCLANSTHSANMYFNYTKLSSTRFSVTYAEYLDMNCTVLRPHFPKTTIYSSSCGVVGQYYTTYSYTEEFPKLTNGLVKAYFLTESVCGTQPQDFAVAIGFPGGYCLAGTGGTSFSYTSCTSKGHFS